MNAACILESERFFFSWLAWEKLSPVPKRGKRLPGVKKNSQVVHQLVVIILLGLETCLFLCFIFGHMFSKDFKKLMKGKHIFSENACLFWTGTFSLMEKMCVCGGWYLGIYSNARAAGKR